MFGWDLAIAEKRGQLSTWRTGLGIRGAMAYIEKRLLPLAVEDGASGGSGHTEPAGAIDVVVGHQLKRRGCQNTADRGPS
jgi:hypothetical protein